MSIWKFDVELAPIPSNQRLAMFVRNKMRVVQSAGVRRHQETIAAVVASKRPPGGQIDGPVRLSIDFIMPRTKALCARSKVDGRPLRDTRRRYHVNRPDIDNLSKSLMDGLRSWWRDDCIVCELFVRKRIAAMDESPRYVVTIELIGDGGENAVDD